MCLLFENNNMKNMRQIYLLLSLIRMECHILRRIVRPELILIFFIAQLSLMFWVFERENVVGYIIRRQGIIALYMASFMIIFSNLLWDGKREWITYHLSGVNWKNIVFAKNFATFLWTTIFFIPLLIIQIHVFDFPIDEIISIILYYVFISLLLIQTGNYISVRYNIIKSPISIGILHLVVFFILSLLYTFIKTLLFIPILLYCTLGIAVLLGIWSWLSFSVPCTATKLRKHSQIIS